MSIQSFVKDRVTEQALANAADSPDKKDGFTIYVSRDVHLKLKNLANFLGVSKTALASKLVAEAVDDAIEATAQIAGTPDDEEITPETHECGTYLSRGVISAILRSPDSYPDSGEE
jgi:hypothetical protein